MQEETLRLKSEVDASGAEQATYAFAELNETIERLSAVAPEADRDLKHLVDVLSRKGQIYAFADEVQHADEWLAKLSQDAEKAAASATKAGAGMGQAGTPARDVGNAALQASRALEDLQYGFGGVVNNIPGVVQALGGPAGLVAAFSLLFVGINQVVNHWSDLKAMFQDKNPFPEAADKVKTLDAALAENAKHLDELRDKQGLTNAELKTFNELTAESIKLEKEKAVEEEKARQRKEKGAEESGLVADFRKALAEVGYHDAVVFLTDAIHRVNKSRGLAFNKAEAVRLLAEAGTDADAASQVNSFLSGQENRFAYELRDPGGRKAKEREELRARVAQKQAEKEKADAETRKKAADKLVDDLNEQGARNEVETFADQAKKDDAGRKQAEQAKKKADADADRKAAEYAKQYDRTGLQQQAEFRALQLQSQGLSPEAAQSRTQAELARFVAGRDRALSPDQAGAVARHVGKGASEDLARRQNALQMAGLSAQQQTVQIAADLNAEVGQLQNKLLHVDEQVKQLRREVNARRRSVQSRGKP